MNIKHKLQNISSLPSEEEFLQWATVMPDVYAWSSLRAEGMHIRPITSAHVTTNILWHIHITGMHVLNQFVKYNATSKNFKSYYINRHSILCCIMYNWFGSKYWHYDHVHSHSKVPGSSAFFTYHLLRETADLYPVVSFDLPTQNSPLQDTTGS